MKFVHTFNKPYYAWKALYLYAGDGKGKQIAHLGIDPFSEYGMLKPQVFGGLYGRTFRFTLPYLAYNPHRDGIMSQLEKIQNSFWYKFKHLGIS